MLRAQMHQHLCQQFGEVFIVHPEHLDRRPRGIRQGAKDIQEGRDAHLLAGRRAMLHRTVEQRRKEKTNTDLVEALGHLLCREIDPHPEGFQHVGTAGLGGYGPIAVLGDGQAGAGDHKGGRRGDVERIGSVPTRSAGIDELLVPCLDPRRPGPHGPRRACDFLDRFTFHPQGHEVGRDLGRGGFPRHDLEHHLLGLFLRQVSPVSELRNGGFNHGDTSGEGRWVRGDRLVPFQLVGPARVGTALAQSFKKFRNKSIPAAVRMDSG